MTTGYPFEGYDGSDESFEVLQDLDERYAKAVREDAIPWEDAEGEMKLTPREVVQLEDALDPPEYQPDEEPDEAMTDTLVIERSQWGWSLLEDREGPFDERLVASADDVSDLISCARKLGLGEVRVKLS